MLSMLDAAIQQATWQLEVCVHHCHSVRLAVNSDKFAHFMTHPLIQTSTLTQPLTFTHSGKHSHYRSLIHHLHKQCHAFAHSISSTHQLSYTLNDNYISCRRTSTTSCPFISTCKSSLNISVQPSHPIWSQCHHQSRKHWLSWCLPVMQENKSSTNMHHPCQFSFLNFIFWCCSLIQNVKLLRPTRPIQGTLVGSVATVLSSHPCVSSGPFY